MRGSHTHFDEIETAFRKDDCSFEVLRATYSERTGERWEDTDFVSFGLAKSDGFLTNAGVLLADQPVLRQNRVFCTRWNGLDKAKADGEVLDDHEYSGCLVRLLREAMDFVGRHNRVAWAKTDDDRIETPSYVMRAVEEAIVNALIHRQYEIGGAEVTAFVYDDRLEITSPGSKVDGALPEDADLGAVESIRRNPVIADLFQRMRFMERKGSGLKLIRERTALAPNYEERFIPQFIDNGRFFKVVLWNMNRDSAPDTPQDTPQDTPPSCSRAGSAWEQ